ncbi:hypothetical protein [Nocardioides panzhihuensis]|uniref:Uncharacterized protein n=1 Tax=Nocardioides panzhihuensis TaxID=860243 RepID=A0A7Z0DNP1_9ACTN|nr:hypothetical protein [Nocardioides panzhihuensis]NYI78735.1 hypothetical protein [Nocardioides panzhihuensis]
MSDDEPISAHVYRIRRSLMGVWTVFRYACSCGCTIGGFGSREEAEAAAEEHIATEQKAGRERS